MNHRPSTSVAVIARLLLLALTLAFVIRRVRCVPGTLQALGADGNVPQEQGLNVPDGEA